MARVCADVCKARSPSQKTNPSFKSGSLSFSCCRHGLLVSLSRYDRRVTTRTTTMVTARPPLLLCLLLPSFAAGQPSSSKCQELPLPASKLPSRIKIGPHPQAVFVPAAAVLPQGSSKTCAGSSQKTGCCSAPLTAARLHSDNFQNSATSTVLRSSVTPGGRKVQVWCRSNRHSFAEQFRGSTRH